MIQLLLKHNFALNNLNLYDRIAFIKRNVAFNKIVHYFIDTLYMQSN